MGSEHAQDRTIFHRERGVRIFIGVLGALFVLPTIGILVDLISEPDPVGFLFLAWCAGLFVLYGRLLVSRLVVDRHGVVIVDVVRRRRYAWSEVDRFEVSKWSRRAIMVLRSGKTVQLLGYRVSPAEAVRGTGSPTERLVDDLNALQPDDRSHDERLRS